MSLLAFGYGLIVLIVGNAGRREALFECDDIFSRAPLRCYVTLTCLWYCSQLNLDIEKYLHISQRWLKFVEIT